MNTMNNVKMVESEMITSTLEREIKRLIIRAQKEVVEVCAKEYNFDIKLAMLLIGAGGGKEPKERKEKKERGKKPTASGIAKVVKDMVEGKQSSRGRPKNPEKVVEVEETENLFEQLVKQHIETEEVALRSSSVEFQTKEEKKEEESAEKEERSMMSGAEKEIKVVNKLEAKEQEKLAKEAEKLAKESEKAIAIAKAKLAKEAEKLAKEQTKEAEKLAKEKAKEAEKLAKASAKTSAKASAKTESGSDTDTSSKSKKEKNTKVSAKKRKETAERVAKEATDVENQAKMNDLSKKLEVAAVNPVAVVAVVAASAPATLKVKSFKYEGATYFREKNTGAIYDKDTNDHLGQWNEATQKIEFLEAEEELEEEEESDGESSDEEEEEEDA
jgi:hypothetical protein